MIFSVTFIGKIHLYDQVFDIDVFNVVTNFHF